MALPDTNVSSCTHGSLDEDAKIITVQKVSIRARRRRAADGSHHWWRLRKVPSPEKGGLFKRRGARAPARAQKRHSLGAG